MRSPWLLIYAEKFPLTHRTTNTLDIKTLNLNTMKMLFFLSLCVRVVHGKGYNLVRCGSTEGDGNEQRWEEESCPVWASQRLLSWSGLEVGDGD